MGPMLWPQFSVIFAHFRQKYWRFLKTNAMFKFLQKLALF
jgi:hypothetical protein